jgi:hypothetical protein
MTVDEKIAELGGLLARARAVKAAYPDAEIGLLPNGNEAWMSPSVVGTKVYPSITQDAHPLSVLCLYRQLGDVAVFEGRHARVTYAYTGIVFDQTEVNPAAVIPAIRRSCH